MSAAWESLLALMDRLREPGGCPWDREQTPATLRGYLLEEAYELAEAIDSGDPAGQREELGDLLFQIVFLARIAKEQGLFDADDVAREVTAKMIRRHPHVFAGASAADATEVLRQWEEIKRAEKPSPATASALDGIPRGLPALLRAHRLGTKAARIGFDWDSATSVLAKVREETGELEAALVPGEHSPQAAGRVSNAPDATDAGEEWGDLLFAVVSVGRHLGLDPEAALQRANGKFERRFRALEQILRNSHPAGSSADEAGPPGPELLEAIWSRVKRDERGAGETE